MFSKITANAVINIPIRLKGASTEDLLLHKGAYLHFLSAKITIILIRTKKTGVFL